jgi:hypothetical protein
MNEIFIALPLETSIQDFRDLVLSDHEFDSLLQSFPADLDEDARCDAMCRDFEDREDGRFFMESEAYERDICEMT